MADMIGAGAAMAAAARGKVRLEDSGGGAVNTAFVQSVVGDLSPAMCAALRERQPDLFDRDRLQSGHPATIKALVRRGIVERPGLRLTEFGEMVASAAGLAHGGGTGEP